MMNNTPDLMPKIRAFVDSSWERVFTVSYLHNYYLNRICKDFDVLPTEMAKEDLRRFKLVFKPLANGFGVIGDSDKSFQLMRDPRYGLVKLSFLLYSKNNKFINYSDLPFLGNDYIYSFNNLNKNINTEGEKLAHAKIFVGAQEADKVQLVPRGFEYSFGKETKHEDIEIIDVFGNKIPILPVTNSPAEKHFIDLRHLAPARFSLKFKNSKTNLLEFYTKDSSFEKCFGIIDIYIQHKNIPKEYAILTDKGIQFQDYHIQFDTRQTYWRYFIIPNKNVEYTSYQITHKDGKIQFEDPQTVELSTGAEATVIVTKSPIPLKDKPNEIFELQMKKAKGTGSAMTLPCAKTDSIKPDKTTGKIYSDIFIYL